MIRATQFGEVLLKIFEVLLRDVTVPLVGVYLVLRLGQGAFEGLAIPAIATLASGMIGLPIWSRSDQRSRDANGGEKPRKRGRGGFSITIGTPGGDDDRDQTNGKNRS